MWQSFYVISTRNLVQSNKSIFFLKITNGTLDDNGLEIWVDDTENCIEVEETECRVQEIPVPEDEEDEDEEDEDEDDEDEEEEDEDEKEPTTTTTTTEAPEEEPENTAILFFDD